MDRGRQGGRRNHLQRRDPRPDGGGRRRRGRQRRRLHHGHVPVRKSASRLSALTRLEISLAQVYPSSRCHNAAPGGYARSPTAASPTSADSRRRRSRWACSTARGPRGRRVGRGGLASGTAAAASRTVSVAGRLPPKRRRGSFNGAPTAPRAVSARTQRRGLSGAQATKPQTRTGTTTTRRRARRCCAATRWPRRTSRW